MGRRPPTFTSGWSLHLNWDTGRLEPVLHKKASHKFDAPPPPTCIYRYHQQQVSTSQTGRQDQAYKLPHADSLIITLTLMTLLLSTVFGLHSRAAPPPFRAFATVTSALFHDLTALERPRRAPFRSTLARALPVRLCPRAALRRGHVSRAMSCALLVLVLAGPRRGDVDGVRTLPLRWVWDAFWGGKEGGREGGACLEHVKAGALSVSAAAISTRATPFAV